MNKFINGSLVVSTALPSPTVLDSDAVSVYSSPATLSHSLAAKPSFWNTKLVCISAELGFSIGDEAEIMWAYSSRQVGINVDDSNFIIWRAAAPAVSHKTTGAATAIDMTKWKFRFRYWE